MWAPSSLIIFVLLICYAKSLPVTSKPIENTPEHLAWEAWLLIPPTQNKTRKITPKSIFILPNKTSSPQVNCPHGHVVESGICIKTVHIDPNTILLNHLANVLNNTSYDFDYDYDEYDESQTLLNEPLYDSGPLKIDLLNTTSLGESIVNGSFSSEKRQLNIALTRGEKGMSTAISSTISLSVSSNGVLELLTESTATLIKRFNSSISTASPPEISLQIQNSTFKNAPEELKSKVITTESSSMYPTITKNFSTSHPMKGVAKGVADSSTEIPSVKEFISPYEVEKAFNYTAEDVEHFQSPRFTTNNEWFKPYLRTMSDNKLDHKTSSVESKNALNETKEVAKLPIDNLGDRFFYHQLGSLALKKLHNDSVKNFRTKADNNSDPKLNSPYKMDVLPFLERSTISTLFSHLSTTTEAPPIIPQPIIFSSTPSVRMLFKRSKSSRSLSRFQPGWKLKEPHLLKS